MITVASWNILAPLWVHTQHFPDVEPSIFHIETRRKSIGRTLMHLASNVDIICLQEVQRSELEHAAGLKLLENLDFEIASLSHNEHTCWRQWLIEGSMEDNGTIILLKKNKFSQRKITRELISEDGNAATLLTCLVNGVPLVLVNSHFDTDSPLRRELQAKCIQSLFEEALADLLLTLSPPALLQPCHHPDLTSDHPVEYHPEDSHSHPEDQSDGHHVRQKLGDSSVSQKAALMWVGDFNMQRDNELIRNIVSNGWRDLLQEKNADLPTLCSARRLPQAIDFIFSKSGMTVHQASVPEIELRSTPAEFCSWAVEKFGSDHLPVMVSVGW